MVPLLSLGGRAGGCQAGIPLQRGRIPGDRANADLKYEVAGRGILHLPELGLRVSSFIFFI